MKAVESALGGATVLLRRTTTRIAVVGASNDPGKYGNIIVKDLLKHGYQVFPVNPHETTIAGQPVFRSLADVPKPVDLVDVVTPPDVTRRILKDAADAGLGLVWLQDGSFDEAVLKDVAAAPFKTVHHACIMVVARQAHPSGG
jgi:predicted CoA-binding protein